ncbi:MAG TPA: hypothetical protein VNM90_14825 [Haliangium sp.]|nr:hypothetical protein [Haliangium sp.]
MPVEGSRHACGAPAVAQIVRGVRERAQDAPLVQYDVAVPKANATWNVLPHDPVIELASNLRQVTGDLPNMPLRRTMIAVRMQDGRLLLHNPIALEDELMRELERWGTPAFLVVPNGWHRLDCAVFKQRYPEARVVCPSGSRKKVEEVTAVDLTYDAFPGDESVSLAHLSGLREVEGVLTVRSEDGVTLVFNDAVFNVPHLPGLQGVVMRLLGSTGGPRVTRVMRIMAVKDKGALREHLRALASTPALVRVVPGHGHVITRDAAATLGAVAGAL